MIRLTVELPYGPNAVNEIGNVVMAVLIAKGKVTVETQDYPVGPTGELLPEPIDDTRDSKPHKVLK